MNLTAPPATWDAWRAWALSPAPGSALAEHADAFGELAVLRGVPQSPHWHPEGDVLTHVLLAADRAAAVARERALSVDDTVVVVLAALLHDTGKAACTKIDGDTITSAGHAAAGEAPARAFCERAGAPGAVVEQVARLVAEHMSHSAATMPPTRHAVRRLLARLGAARLEQWACVVDADRNGRGLSSVDESMWAWVDVAGTLSPARHTRIITGAHLKALGMAPGEHFRQILDDAHAAHQGGVFADEAGGVAWVREHVIGHLPPAVIR